MATVSLPAVRHALAAVSPRRAERSDRELLAEFTAGHDPSAFAALVRRHGPMVLGVCRRVLGHEQDAEDAFQATFLVLARKAPSVRKGDSLASFLHGVAYRVALRARRDAARRRRLEGRARRASPADPATEAAWREVQEALDDEVQRLPADFRDAFVLCCLNGLSKPEAARRLGLNEGTLSSRLARARRRLQEQLRRRGVVLSGVLSAPVSAALTDSAASAAVHFAAGQAPALASARLAQGALKGMAAQKLKWVGVLLLALGVLGAGVGVLAGRAGPAGESARAAPAKARPAEAPKEKATSILVRGRVLRPDGKPAGRAAVYLLGVQDPAGPKKPRVLSGAGGTFRFSFDPEELARPGGQAEPWRDAGVVAVAEGFGPALAGAERAAEGPVTLRLVPDLPVEGRVLTLEGQPVAGARVRLRSLRDFGGEAGLSAYLKVVGTGIAPPHAGKAINSLPGRPNEWKTDKEGRFRIEGLGRDRVALLEVGGPGIARRNLQVMTRAGKPVLGRRGRPGEEAEVIYPAKFSYAAKPGRTLTGVVRDDRTGEPVAGIKVTAESVNEGVVTDAKGRYELAGLPKGSAHRLYLAPARGEVPYLPARFTVADTPGLAPIRAAQKLRRGIPLRVRVADAGGKPVRVWVYYVPLFPNAEVPDDLPGLLVTAPPRGHGRYTGVVLPGPGAVCAMHLGGRYVPASVDQKKFFRLERMPDEEKRFPSGESLWTGGRNPNPLPQSQFQAIALIDPKPGAKEVSLALKLDPGRAVTLRLRDAEGKPLAGVRVWDWRGSRWSLPLAGAGHTVTGLAPKRPTHLLFRHEGKKLAAAVTVTGDESGPVTVKLRPWGTVTGRLVDRAGKPLGDHRLGAGNPPPGRKRTLSLSGEVRTDEKGAFRLDRLVPGYEYHLRVERYFPEVQFFVGVGKLAKPIVARPGEQDLGDVRMVPFKE